jgi:hypothetical protein
MTARGPSFRSFRGGFWVGIAVAIVLTVGGAAVLA